MLIRNLVNVKVKSGEGIGMIGREEGIAAQAVCLIESVKSEHHQRFEEVIRALSGFITYLVPKGAMLM